MANRTNLPLILMLIIVLITGCNRHEKTSQSLALTDDDAGSDNIISAEIPHLSIESGEQYFLQPAGHLTDANKIPGNMDRDTVHSFIFVQLKDSLQRIRQYQRGNTIEISLNNKLSITARINRNQAVGRQIRNLTATIIEPHRGVLTLSVADNSITGNIDLLSEDRLFHIRFDPVSGLHYLAEINREKLDVIEGSEPLEGN